MISRYRLAPMDTLLRVMTWVCYAIPLILLASALSVPPPVREVLFAVVALVVALYVGVWFLMRPRAFVITPDTLEIEWPVRRRSIPRSAIVSARVLTKDQLREELGRIMRIGAGGLWGGFGLATTSKGMHELWVSRVDRMVLIGCEGRRSLLVTPEDAERFIAELGPSGSSTRSNSK